MTMGEGLYTDALSWDRNNNQEVTNTLHVSVACCAVFELVDWLVQLCL